MQYAETVAALGAIPLFSQLGTSTRKLLAFSSSYLSFHDGENLFLQDAVSDSVYVIQEGCVDVIVVQEGEEVVVARMGRDDIVGEMGVFRNAPRSATIRAVGSVQVIKIEADVFIKAVTGDADASLGVMRMLSDKLATMTVRYEKLKQGRET
jgi:CRP-like cAMP-binding protein